MSYDDFCRLTPEEFGCVWEKYGEMRESVYRDGWERTRWMATVGVQPHVRKKITARQLLPLPWDGERRKMEKIEDKETGRKRMERRLKMV